MTEGMRKFAARYQFSLSDPDLRRMYEYELSAIRDQQSREQNAEKRGEARGVKIGETRTYEKMIRGLLRNGVSSDIIYNCVDVPRSEVDAIISKVRAGN